MPNERVRIVEERLLSDHWYTLKTIAFDWRRSDGRWQRQHREAYDRGNGAVLLLFNAAAGTVVLTRQFRMPAYLNGCDDGLLIEACAGLLDGEDPETCIRREAVEERRAELERKYGVKLHLVGNDKAEEWNNAYSLWCARDVLAEGVILANGDTVHPASVERTLLAARGGDKKIILALDTVKKLAEEEMKVVADPAAGVRRITKLMDPSDATGEYIGVTLIEPEAAAALADALKATYERDPQLYYEDGYQELVDRGFQVDTAPIGEVAWVEIDNHDDLNRAREIACQY